MKNNQFSVSALARLVLCFVCAVSISHRSSAADATNNDKAFKVEKHGKGSPIILIPGLGCSGDVWKDTVAVLEKNHECHVLTLAGFAGVPPISAPLMDAVPVQLAKYIQDQKLHQPVIIGHSMGGFLAIRMAAEHPAETGPIVIVDSMPFLGGVYQPGATAETIRPMAEMLASRMATASHDEFMASTKGTMAMMVISPENQQKGYDWMNLSDQKTVGQAMSTIISTDLRPALPKIHSRALQLSAGIVPGAVPEDVVKSQYAGLKNVKIVRDPKARHFLMLDDPEFFMTQVKAFLGDK